jgi:hypothetical protein
MVGSSWEMFESILKVLCGVDVIVVNTTVVTSEARQESKQWLTDMLTIHKTLVGEIKDKKTLSMFWGGPDYAIARRNVKKIDEKDRERRRVERAQRRVGVQKSREPIDLDDVFE